MKSNNMIELTPYLDRKPIYYNKKRRKAARWSARFSAALDVFCYLALLICLIVGAGALAVLV